MQEISSVEGYSWKENIGLEDTRRERLASNAIIVVKEHNIINSVHGCREEFVCSYLYDTGKESDRFVISARELMQGKFLEKRPPEVIVFPGYMKKMVEVLRLYIQKQLRHITPNRITEYEHGWSEKHYHINNVDEMFRQSSSENAYSNATLLADLIGREQCVAGITVAAIHGVLLQPSLEAGINHNYVTYIVGQTDKGKSSVAKAICNCFSGMNNCLSLGSDKRELKKISCHSNDVTVVLDDLCLSESHQMTEKLVDKVSEIIQNASDSGTVLFSGADGEESVRNHIVITAEKLIRNPSTINRCFVMWMDESLSDEDWRSLNKFAKTGKMQEVMYTFILWVQENYDEIVRMMETDYYVYLDRAKKGLQHAVPGINRIRNTIAVQLVLRKRLIDYLAYMRIDERILSKAEAMLSKCIWNGGNEMCDYLLEQKNKVNRKQYLPILAEFVTQLDNGVWLAPTEQEYNAWMYGEKKNLGKCIGLCLNRGYWSFCPRRMSELVAEEKGVESVSVKSLGAELKYYSLAYTDCEGKLSSKWHSDKRMYHVRVKELLELVYPGIDVSVFVKHFL